MSVVRPAPSLLSDPPVSSKERFAPHFAPRLSCRSAADDLLIPVDDASDPSDSLWDVIDEPTHSDAADRLSFPESKTSTAHTGLRILPRDFTALSKLSSHPSASSSPFTDLKSLSGNNTLPTVNRIPAPVPTADAPSLPASQASPPAPLPARAFRLAHASDELWPFTGLPLSVLKAQFPDKFVNHSHSVCTFCHKKGHPVAACPLSSSDRTVPLSPFFEELFQPAAVIGTLHKSVVANPLAFAITSREASQHGHSTESSRDPHGTAAISSATSSTSVDLDVESRKFLEAGKRYNATNPFLSEPANSLWALPKCLGFWKSIGCPKSQLTWLSYGYELRFLAPPPMVGFDNHAGAFTHYQFIDSEIEKRVLRGQFSVVDKSYPKQLHPIDVVPKASGGYRFILDCRLINGFLPDAAFKLENLSIVPQIVQKGSFLFSTDLEDAYFHIPMHPKSRPHLCFQWRGVYYRSNVLPFGLSLAPWVFTKTLRPLVRYCRSLGISVVAYLDDFLWSAGKPSVDKLVTFVLAVIAALGFSISNKKSDLTPKQVLLFLGLLVNSESLTFEVPKEKLAKILAALSVLLAKAEVGQKITAQNIAVITGYILAIRLAVAPARIYTRALYACMNQAPYWTARVELSAAALNELKFWKSELPNFTSYGMLPAHSSVRLYCDASDDGWGAHCNAATAFGFFHTNACAPVTSSTHRELLGLLCAIQSPELSRQIENRRVTFVLDSLAGVFNLNKGGGPKADLSLLVKQIWNVCSKLGVDATAEWISRNNNEYADALSKHCDRADWKLNRNLFVFLDRKWGPHSVDRFASAQNFQCPRYNSRYYDPSAEAINAFHQCWSSENNYANPDFNEVSRVLEHCRADCAAATVVIPVWPSAPWYIPLLQAAVDCVALPAFADTFTAGPRSRDYVLTAPNWCVAAVRLDFRRVQNQTKNS